jgi:hypothetical protein
MLAIHNYALRKSHPDRGFLRRHCLTTLLTWIGFAYFAQGEGIDGKWREFTARAQEKYVAAQESYLAQPANAEAAWRFAQACFDRAEYATNNAERAATAQEGIAACRELLARNVRIAPAHHYLAMNLGQLARTKTLGALKIVDEMEREFKMARALDEHLDYAGPDRCLGLLYLEAPRIASIGNRSKARQHLLRAIALAPDYPDNRLNFAEACLKWTDYHLAKRELKALDEAWPRARANFTCLDWEASWLDWETRLQRLRKNIEEQTKAEAGRSKI